MYNQINVGVWRQNPYDQMLQPIWVWRQNPYHNRFGLETKPLPQ
ncbi:hypothetical protein [Okeania sp.]|nr:hypothetical protein [Okeania sp.]MEB3342817.1 hypothetical protein [Okeania sp.]